MVMCMSVAVEVQDRPFLPRRGSCGWVNHQRTVDAMQKGGWQFYVISRSTRGEARGKVTEISTGGIWLKNRNNFQEGCRAAGDAAQGDRELE